MKRGPGPKRRTPLRSRSWRERWADRPDVYGEVFEAVKRAPCWGLAHVPDHRCDIGHTAHHDPPVGKGGTDLSGLLPTCEVLHRILDQRSIGTTRKDLLEALAWTEEDLARLARSYVLDALETLYGLGGAPADLRPYLIEAGLEQYGED